MTKIEAIKILSDNGVFELTQEILDIIYADSDSSHETANKDIYNLINSIHQMSEWTLFSWKVMIDLACQVYGFTKYLAYSKVVICADVVDEIEELHDILWSNFSNMEVWNG